MAPGVKSDAIPGPSNGLGQSGNHQRESVIIATAVGLFPDVLVNASQEEDRIRRNEALVQLADYLQSEKNLIRSVDQLKRFFENMQGSIRKKMDAKGSVTGNLKPEDLSEAEECLWEHVNVFGFNLTLFRTIGAISVGIGKRVRPEGGSMASVVPPRPAVNGERGSLSVPPRATTASFPGLSESASSAGVSSGNSSAIMSGASTSSRLAGSTRLPAGSSILSAVQLRATSAVPSSPQLTIRAQQHALDPSRPINVVRVSPAVLRALRESAAAQQGSGSSGQPSAVISGHLSAAEAAILGISSSISGASDTPPAARGPQAEVPGFQPHLPGQQLRAPARVSAAGQVRAPARVSAPGQVRAPARVSAPGHVRARVPAPRELRAPRPQLRAPRLQLRAPRLQPPAPHVQPPSSGPPVPHSQAPSTSRQNGPQNDVGNGATLQVPQPPAGASASQPLAPTNVSARQSHHRATGGRRRPHSSQDNSGSEAEEDDPDAEPRFRTRNRPGGTGGTGGTRETIHSKQRRVLEEQLDVFAKQEALIADAAKALALETQTKQLLKENMEKQKKNLEEEERQLQEKSSILALKKKAADLQLKIREAEARQAGIPVVEGSQ